MPSVYLENTIDCACGNHTKFMVGMTPETGGRIRANIDCIGDDCWDLWGLESTPDEEVQEPATYVTCAECQEDSLTGNVSVSVSDLETLERALWENS